MFKDILCFTKNSGKNKNQNGCDSDGVNAIARHTHIHTHTHTHNTHTHTHTRTHTIYTHAQMLILCLPRVFTSRPSHHCPILTKTSPHLRQFNHSLFQVRKLETLYGDNNYDTSHQLLTRWCSAYLSLCFTSFNKISN